MKGLSSERTLSAKEQAELDQKVAAVGRKELAKLDAKTRLQLQQSTDAIAIAHDVSTRLASDGAAGFDALTDVLQQRNDTMMDQYRHKRAEAAAQNGGMWQQTKADIAAIDATVAANKQQRAMQAAQIQLRYANRAIDFRIANPAYRRPEPLFSYDSALAADNTMWGAGKQRTHLKLLAQGTTEVLADTFVSLGAYLPGTSIDAKYELLKFRDGLPGTNNYGVGSAGSNELMKSEYYQDLSKHVVGRLNDYYGGNIPDGLSGIRQSYIGANFRKYTPLDAVKDLVSDGITMPDVVGSMTYGVEVSTKDGFAIFKGVNVTSLTSFSRQNILRHNLVHNYSNGPLMNSKQTFEWVYPLPSNEQTYKYVPIDSSFSVPVKGKFK